MEQAACRGKGPEQFFLERGQSVKPGKAVCKPCPVRTECSEYADRSGTEYGMWGGAVRKRGAKP